MRRIILSVMLLAVSLQAQDIYATFTVEAKKSANLAFTSSGTVNNVLVDVSTEVKKGDVLAELQNDDLKAALNIATTALKYAKKEYNRQLKVKKLLDASKLDSYALQYESAKAKVLYQQALLDKTILKAPFDGVIYEKLVEEGDVVSGAMIRTVLKMQSLHERKLVLEFDQKYWKEIKIGQVFHYSIDGDSKKYSGKISKIYPYADSGNRKIRAEVEAKDFVPGLFGDGTITLSEK
ncbi:MAG TPA: efflux RND transporter periplasmic adaptor subunit [Epsilonproteobacteria bacterium]|nr:efflux RND transporter periplasmic adaptor subunit [Campylobacterota bacterium]HHE06225.1 efflux RND transporter periplasmic adaptor subunit [Campylobacterota bacterium]